jgi:deoxyribodipyrimidine photolyase-related protein
LVRDLIIILGDQLSLEISSLEKIRKNEDKILMMEVSNEMEYANHHKKKLVLIFSAMRHFANELKKKGFDITYVEFDKSEENFTKELERQCKKFNPKSIKITHPSEYRVLDEVKKWEKVLGITVTVLEDSRFFCKIDEFSDWANSRKELKMELFYQKMRKKYNILIDNEGKPVGGKWNYDIKNRNRLPKNHSKIPNPLVCKPDKITKRVISQLREKHAKHFGDLEPFWFATTREDAVKSLDDFIQNRLEFFGPYEDAMKENEKFLYHSVLSVYLNIGLLNPRDVIQKVLENKDLPIESIEASIERESG